MLKKYVTNNPKLICTVRHPLDILASFITLIHKDKTLSFIDKAMLQNGMTITDDNRCHYMMNPDGIVGNPYTSTSLSLSFAIILSKL